MQCTDVTRQELLVLDAWLKSDPAHAEAYARMNKVSHLGLKLREHPEETARLGAYQRLRAAEHAENAAAPRLYALRWAAAAVIGIVIATLAAIHWPESRTHYVVGHGEQRHVTLPDGSRMTVNTNSEVKVLFDPAARIIALPRGEAFFEVAQNKTRPFIVRAGETEIRALGTKFNVHRENTRTEVLVAEGHVRVLSTRDATIEPRDLFPGDQLQLETSTRTASVTTVDAARETSWVSGMVAFEDTPLDQVVSEINRYIRKPFIITAPQLSTIRLTGRFRTGDMESVKFALRDRFGIEAMENEREIRLGQ